MAPYWCCWTHSVLPYRSQDAKNSGRKLPLASYNAAIDACGKAKQVDRALGLFDDLIAAGCTPDAVTYTALIDACGRCDMLDQAFALFRRMQGSSVPPNLITYNALIHACAQASAVDAAFQVWDQMRYDGSAMCNVRTYTGLVAACCKADNLEGAFHVLYQMQARARPPRPPARVAAASIEGPRCAGGAGEPEPRHVRHPAARAVPQRQPREVPRPYRPPRSRAVGNRSETRMTDRM